MCRYWTYPLKLTFLGLGVLVFAAAGVSALLAADDKQGDQAGKTSPLARDLVGTWILAGTPEKFDDPPSPKGPLKFFTGKHWTFTQADPASGKVVYHHGGTYTLEGDNYAETVNYANESTAPLIGQTLKFKLKLNGDTLVQVGVGNPYSQVWKRAK
jgi:hypothetical protein